jgi:uncharacterized membrane protein (DUF106 family)
MIAIFNSGLGYLFNALLYPFRSLSPWIAMIVLSLLTAIAMLLVFRFVSNQAGIRSVKNRIAAHLLELRLYQDNLPVTLRAQGNILWCNVRYLMHSLKPMLVMILPLTLVIIQLDLRFGYRALDPGESVLLKVRLKEGHQPSLVAASLDPSSGFAIDTPPLRIDSERELDWRLRAVAPGKRELAIRVGEETLTKQIVIGRAEIAGVSLSRVDPRWLEQLLNPAERPLAEGSAVESIRIDYPSRSMNLSGWHLHWLIVYFALSVLFGFALKGVLRVEA